MSMRTAQATNAWFLGVVASWRVALLFTFLRRVAGLGAFAVVVATLLPIVFIVTALTALNLEHVVFELMAGIREPDQSVNDGAYHVVILITVFSMLAAPVLLIAYGWLVFRARTSRKTV
jgi:hypothetical protein